MPPSPILDYPAGEAAPGRVECHGCGRYVPAYYLKSDRCEDCCDGVQRQTAPPPAITEFAPRKMAEQLGKLAAAGLSFVERQALVLFYYEGLTAEQAAKLSTEPVHPGTIDRRLGKARAKLEAVGLTIQRRPRPATLTRDPDLMKLTPDVDLELLALVEDETPFVSGTLKNPRTGPPKR